MSAIFSTPNGVGITPPEILELDSRNLHTNFKISSESETISLSNAFGEMVDQLTVENLPPDTSLGVSDINDDLVIYNETSPGYENSNNYFLGAIDSSVAFSNNGGFLSESIKSISFWEFKRPDNSVYNRRETSNQYGSDLF